MAVYMDAQVTTIFAMIDATLRKAGGSLVDLVTMTVFINDRRHSTASSSSAAASSRTGISRRAR